MNGERSTWRIELIAWRISRLDNSEKNNGKDDEDDIAAVTAGLIESSVFDGGVILISS